jgi:hypothetical protein
MTNGLAAISAHLVEHGVEVPAVSRTNESVVPYPPELITSSAAAAVQQLNDAVTTRPAVTPLVSS